MNEFIHLHGHSTYSLRDAIGHPSEIIETAEGLGMDRIAITDHGHMNYLAPFYLTAKKKKFMPIFGIEAYYIPSIEEWKKVYDSYKKEDEPQETHNEHEGEDEDVTRKLTVDPRRDYAHMVILARNYDGLKDLFKLVYHSNVDGYYYRPRMDFDMLSKWSKNLVITSACMGGFLAKFILRNQNNPSLIVEHVTRQIQLFDEITDGHFFPEIQFNKYPEQQIVNRTLIAICKSLGHKWVATNDYHFPKKEYFIDRFILKETALFSKRDSNHKIEIPKLEESPWQGWIKSRDEMNAFAKEACPYLSDEDSKAGMDTACWIGNELIDHYEIDTQPRLYFDFKEPFEQIVKICKDKMAETGLAKDQKYVDRIVHELNVVKKIQKTTGVNMAEYFLMMKEIIDLARNGGMLVGVGRGSSAGSLICYLLGITQADPIKFDLLFERFIDPGRVEFPDIDTDFEDAQLAKDLIRDHYGERNVVNITNFGTLQLKSAIKDVSRVWGIDFDEVNRVTKVIEAEARPHVDMIDKALFTWEFDVVKKWSPTFQNFLKKYPQIEQNIDNLMGQARHIGTHAAGLCIAKDIGYKIPILRNREKIQTGYADGASTKNLASMGFIKFDILGLNTLRIIHDACREIATRKQISTDEVLGWIHPDFVDFTDQKVYQEVYHSGKFTSIFQFESDGMRKMCKTFQPRSLEELSAIISLYRPGPLGSGMHNLYLKNKNNPSGIVYKHPLLKEVLQPTWGMMIYQEQIMQICHKLGKMDMAKTNQVRKHFVKRSKESIADVEGTKKKDSQLYGEFEAGCIENGGTKEIATELWNQFREWSSYGFNRSHSICYAIVSYQTAWLRTYYPEEFVLAVLNNDMNVKNLSEIRTQGFKILPIDFKKSKSSWFWDSVEGGFRIPFKIIKGFGDSSMTDLKILQESNSFKEFLWKRKKNKSKVNRSQIESMIILGAFDCFETNRKRLQKVWAEFQVAKRLTEDGLQEIIDKLANDPEEFQVAELKSAEVELYGLTISTNIFTQVQDPILQKYTFDNWSTQKPQVFVEIQKIIKRQTKAGKTFLIINCIDAKDNSQDIKLWNSGHPKIQLGAAVLFQLSQDGTYGWSIRKVL